MKLGFIILISVVLFGCCQTVEKPELDKMTKACADHGGIYKIDTTYRNTAKCSDGQWDFEINKGK